MATTAAALVGTMPTTSATTQDWTKTSFGTPDAAIQWGGSASSGNNPLSADYEFSLGHTLASGAHNCREFNEDHALTTSNCERQSRSADGLFYKKSVTNNIGTSMITDGLRLTQDSGGNTTSQYGAALALNGLTNQAIGSTTLSGTSQSITVGFAADVFICGYTWWSDNAGRSDIWFEFGVIHKNGAGTTVNRGIQWFVWDGQSTTNVQHKISAQYAGQQNAAMSGSFNGNDVDLTWTGTLNRQLHWLALELADPDDCYVGIHDMPTTVTTQAYTGFGFTPDALLIIPTSCTAVDTGTRTTHGTGVGVADSATERYVGWASEDNVGTSNCESHVNLTNIIDQPLDDGTADVTANVDSFDSDGVTLNFTAAPSSALKMLILAFGDSTAAGPVGAPFYSGLSLMGVGV